MKIPSKRYKFLFFLIPVILISGAVGYYYWKNSYPKDKEIQMEEESIQRKQLSGGDFYDTGESGKQIVWKTFKHDGSDISFQYPQEWEVKEECFLDSQPNFCPISVSDGKYVWTFVFDPLVTGGGFGFLFDSVALPLSQEQQILIIDSYNPHLLTYYYDGKQLTQDMDNDTIPQKEIWGGSVTFTNPDEKSTLGFGPGDMYDWIPNTRWAITYRYIFPELSAGSIDYSDIPIKGSEDLGKALSIMNNMSESVKIP